MTEESGQENDINGYVLSSSLISLLNTNASLISVLSFKSIIWRVVTLRASKFVAFKYITNYST